MAYDHFLFPSLGVWFSLSVFVGCEHVLGDH